MSERSKAAMLLVLCAVLFSTGGLLIKGIALPALAIAGLRSAIAAAFLLLVIQPPRFHWSWLHIGGGLACAASMVGFVVATKLTTAANAIFLVYTAPLYVALLSAWFLQEPIRRFDWLTIGLALIGMACFCFERLSSDGWVGNFCALGSGMATAWLVLCLRKQHAAAPLSIVLLGNVLAALVGLPFMFEAMPDPVSWLALLLSGVVQLGVPVMLYCKAIAHVRAIEAVLIPIIEPLLNPLWVFLLLGEVPSVWTLVGGGIVLGAVTARGLGMVWSTARDASTARYRQQPTTRQ